MASRNLSINQATVEAGVTIAAGAAVSFGLIPAADKESVVSAVDIGVAGVFAALAAVRLVGGYLLHKKVTPVADPKDDAGNSLVPAPAPSSVTYVSAPTTGDGPLPLPLGPVSTTVVPPAYPPPSAHAAT